MSGTKDKLESAVITIYVCNRLLCTETTYFSKLQRPIASKLAGRHPHKQGLLELVAFCLSDGTSHMIPAYSDMKIQLLKHTSLSPAIFTAIFGLPWILVAKASGHQTLQMSSQPLQNLWQ